MNPIQLSNPEDWVNQYGDYLFRFAVRRVENQELAEDLVQETFLAALQARDRFVGTSTEKSWLVGILKHKLIDHYRKRSRESVSDDVGWLEAAGEGEGVFDQDGNWNLNHATPKESPSDPSNLLERKEFWQGLNQALSELPPRMAKAYWLREVDGFTTNEICEMLHITPANLWVILSRARMRLRNSLESRLIEFGRESMKPVVAQASVA